NCVDSGFVVRGQSAPDAVEALVVTPVDALDLLECQGHQFVRRGSFRERLVVAKAPRSRGVEEFSGGRSPAPTKQRASRSAFVRRPRPRAVSAEFALGWG